MLLSVFFAFYLSMYLLRLHEYRPETADTNILFVTLGLCIVIYLLKRVKNFTVVQTSYLLGFVAAAIFSHISAFYLAATFDTADELFKLIALYLIASAVFVEKNRTEFYLKFIVVCALIIAIHGIDQFSKGVGWTGSALVTKGVDVARIKYIGVFNDPNDVGMLFVISIPMIFYILSRTNNVIPKIIWSLIAATIFYASYLTGSRGTLLGFIAMMLVYAATKFSRTVTLAVVSAIVPVAFVFTKLSTANRGDASAAGRIDAWGQGIQMLKSNPFFGVGHGLFMDHHSIAAHSSYVEVFSETGLIGYFFWLGFVVMSMYGLYKFSYRYQLDPAKNAIDKEEFLQYKLLSSVVMYSFVGFMVTAFFISRSTQPLLFILCALSAGLYYQIKNKFPDFEMLNFRNTFKICAFLTLGSVLFVYITIRIFW